jgi:hypothetical protein
MEEGVRGLGIYVNYLKQTIESLKGESIMTQATVVQLLQVCKEMANEIETLKMSVENTEIPTEVNI